MDLDKRQEITDMHNAQTFSLMTACLLDFVRIENTLH